jgi:ATP-dependent DNA ligase
LAAIGALIIGQMTAHDVLVDHMGNRFLDMPKPLFPEFVPPMMADSAKAPFDSPDWIFEIKLDGYRAITVFDGAG